MAKDRKKDKEETVETVDAETVEDVEAEAEGKEVDSEKDTVFTRLVYAGRITEQRDIILDPEEHTDFVWISSLEDMEGELIVPYLIDIFADKSI